MGLNETPAASRIHIGIFGRRNAGKSSVVNAITGQEIAIVSEIGGTTTDPVYKAMELLPLGPVLIIDTPGIDDEGSLGALRVKRARQILAKTDAAVLVADAVSGMTEADLELRRLFEERGLRAVIAYNKSDLLPAVPPAPETDGEIYISAKTGFNITALKERIAVIAASDEPQTRLAGDLIKPLDFVTLVVPIDKAAPKGRLILPQQQVIRDVLDSGATALVVKESELRDTLAHLAKKPSLVITDSQAFASVAADTPPDIPLTSFSILFARYKGTLTGALRGVRSLDRLEDHDRLLIAEGCTHHRQCDDIGTVKLPRWLLGHTGKRLDFAFCSGVDFPEDLSAFKAVIHCGGCMLNGREMLRREHAARAQGIPFTNYGLVIAHIQGILNRSVAMFPHILAEIEGA